VRGGRDEPGQGRPVPFPVLTAEGWPRPFAGRHRPTDAALAAEFGARPRASMSGRSIRYQPDPPGTVAGGAAGTRTRTAAVPGHTPRGSSRCNRPKSGQGEAFRLGEHRLDDGNGWGCGRGGHGALPGRAEARKAGLAVAPATMIHPNRQLAPMITQSSCILLSGARCRLGAMGQRVKHCRGRAQIILFCVVGVVGLAAPGGPSACLGAPLPNVPA
jgi:hypothetical protein